MHNYNAYLLIGKNKGKAQSKSKADTKPPEPDFEPSTPRITRSRSNADSDFEPIKGMTN